MCLKGIIKHISTTAQFMLEANVVLPYLHGSVYFAAALVVFLCGKANTSLGATVLINSAL